MKAFVVSLSIILLVFLLTAVNCFFVGKTTSELIELASTLRIDDESVEHFSQKREFFLREKGLYRF